MVEKNKIVEKNEKIVFVLLSCWSTNFSYNW